MVLNRLGDRKGTNLSNVIRFNEAMKTITLGQANSDNIKQMMTITKETFCQ